MQLTAEEEAMLRGDRGPGVRKAMEIVVTLGQIYGAEDLVPIASVQVSGVSYKNLGDAGVEFLEEWAAQGAQALLTAMLNPAGMDLAKWQELGIPKEFARRQEAVLAAYDRLGILPTCTCTPYLVGYAPSYGQHLAWAESSAVSYANSVLGARSNREGGPSALAAAITGRTARYGLHLSENRRATAIIEVRCPLTSEADWGALGYLVGQQVRSGVPFFRLEAPPLHSHSQTGQLERLKALGAAMAASGAIALYHIEGVTPEAKAGDVLPQGGTTGELNTHIIDDLAPGYAALNGDAEAVDLVSLGCPHASLAEIERIAALLDGKRVSTALWITTARATYQASEAAGLVARIAAAGGHVVADTCMVVAPVAELGFRTLATNSAKMAFYTPSHSKLSVRFGPMEQCIEAAITGRWPSPRQ